MNAYRCHRSPRRLPVAPLTLALTLTLAAHAARADDRSLLEPTQKNPYVFIILDVSGSMHQSTACSGQDIASGFCTELCADGDCLPHLMADDPNSKIYVAKQAIYNLMQKHPNVNFGFGHFDQGGMHVHWKYWWYSVATTQLSGFITLDSGRQYPGPGQLEVFGEQAWDCTDARADLGGAEATPLRWTGCPFSGENNVTGTDFPIAGQPTTPQPAHLDNAWEWERVRRYPKLNDDNSTAWWYYIQESSTAPLPPVYRVTFTPVPLVPQTLGAATMQVSISVDKCTNAACDTTINKGTKVMTFNKANEMVYWEPGEGVTKAPSDEGTPPNGGGAFYGDTAREIGITSQNSALAANSNTAHDTYCSPNDSFCVDMQAATTLDPRGPTFSIGNIIPVDWLSNQQAAISLRMAPNLLSPANTVPDFGIATYMLDHRIAVNDDALQLKIPAQRPLAPDGGTPTGHVMNDFFNFLNSWVPVASGASGDPFFSCKAMYVLLVTDGQASGGDTPNGGIGTTSSQCPQFWNWVKGQNLNPAPAYACCVAEALRSYTVPASSPVIKYPVRTYVVGLGLTTLSLGGFNNTLQCVADEGGTGNRHFFNGQLDSASPASTGGFPGADPPPAGFCTPGDPCDGPGPLLPTNPNSVAQALESVLNLIETQATSFASAAVPSLQSNIANESILSSFLPINQPIWPGRLDAYVNPVPLKQTQVTLPDGMKVFQPLPDPTLQCTTPGQQACHLWNAGDQILLQGLAGLDTLGTDPAKRRIYYAPQTPSKPGDRLLFQLPALTDTVHLYDLENAMGLCGTGYTFYPPTVETCTNNSPKDASGSPLPVNLCTVPACSPPATCPSNPCPTQTSASPGISTTAQQAINFTESIKNNTSVTPEVQYLLGDIFHSNPQVLGEPSSPTLFDGNVDSYQAFALAEQFRRKVVLFGSNDGELHAIDAGTVNLGTLGSQPAWVFNSGTGNELFAFIPRTVMPTLNQLGILNTPPASGGSETLMVDGTVTLAEGFFDAMGGTKPQWHSLVIGGLREGGRAYYALDVTQPDTLMNENQPPGPASSTTITVQMPDPNAPNYLPSCLNGGAGCGQVPYASPLWEFTDSRQINLSCVTNCALEPADEDPAPSSGKLQPGFGQPDLGQTWSTPSAGRVRICDSLACTTFHEQWVVVFGGGMDPNAKNSQGNYLYMLDMATGQVIYKRQLNGSAPSDAAAVDTGLDGFIDTIYIGTTAGHLYKVDLTQPAPIVAQAGLGNRVSTTFWQPFEIFDTEGRQMFFPPSVFFDTNRAQFGLAWGSGDRQDLWKIDPLTGKLDATTGRFYVMIDAGLTAATPGLPLKAANLQLVNPDAPAVAQNTLETIPTSGMQPGYYFELNPAEKVLTQAFVLSGVLIFNSYQPKAATGGASGTCVDTGDTRVFVLNLTNGNALSTKTASEGTIAPPNVSGTNSPSNRYFIVGDVLALNITTAMNPATFPTKANPNPVPPPGNGNGPVPDAVQNCDLTQPYVQDMIVQIEKLAPTNCRFSNATISVTLWEHTGSPSCAAPVPVCIIEKNWKEF